MDEHLLYSVERMFDVPVNRLFAYEWGDPSLN